MGLGTAELSFTVLEASKLPEAQYPRWAVLGRSNVGKSSLLNALVHPARFFRSGNTPGLTRGIIAVKVKIGRSEKSILELIDLPGFGFAKYNHNRGDWELLAEALREKSHSVALHWLWLVDPTRSPDELDEQVLDWLGAEPFVFIFTKADRLSRAERQKCVAKWKRFSDHAAEGPVWASALKGEGLEELQKSARQFLRNYHE